MAKKVNSTTSDCYIVNYRRFMEYLFGVDGTVSVYIPGGDISLKKFGMAFFKGCFFKTESPY